MLWCLPDAGDGTVKMKILWAEPRLPAPGWSLLKEASSSARAVSILQPAFEAAQMQHRTGVAAAAAAQSRGGVVVAVSTGRARAAAGEASGYTAAVPAAGSGVAGRTHHHGSATVAVRKLHLL
jgi:hypothetical protein